MNNHSATKINEARSRRRKSQLKVRNLTGFKIQFFRKKRGWTQQRLAESLRKMGVPITREVIANIETQRCRVTDSQIVLFARVLGVSGESLLPEKTIWDKFAQSAIPNRQPESNSSKAKEKSPAEPRATEASIKSWNICEMTCKSVKITFRRPS